MSFAKEPLTIVLCLDHAFVSGGQAKVAFDSAIGLKGTGRSSLPRRVPWTTRSRRPASRSSV
jgi:hypothetical protein